MKVCYFGTYNPEYSRNKILISGLKQNDVEVLECNTNKRSFLKYFDLIKKHSLLNGEYDVLVVGFPGFQAMILAKFLSNKPIIFDAFVSMYDSVVLDRAQTNQFSLKALYLWYLDKISMSLADLVLFDTKSHIDFVSKEFGIDKDKFRRIFVGADTRVFYPRIKNNGEEFKVSFYGHFIPLQGIEYIVEAAKILEKERGIIFEIIGDGQEKKKIMDLARLSNIGNITFLSNLPLEKIAEKMGESNVCLGIFGNSHKAQRVIPNKVYECVAMSKPVITGDTPAVRELFSDREIFLVKVGSGESLAEAILRVKSDTTNAEMVAKKGYEKLLSVASIEKLGKELKEIISSLI